MTAYAPSDVRSITVPHGCGEPHEAGELAEGERFAIDCPDCEPHILAMAGHGWAMDPMQVALTPDESRAFDALERNAKAQQATTWADPRAIGNAVAEALGVAGQNTMPSLLEQIRSMSPEDKTALAALLNISAPSEGDGDPKPAKKAAPSARKTTPAK